MKNLNTFIALGLSLVFVTSCTVGERSFNKRKYTKGVFLAKKDKVKKTDINDASVPINYEEVAVIEENNEVNTVSDRTPENRENTTSTPSTKIEKKESKKAIKSFVAAVKTEKKQKNNAIKAVKENTATDRTFETKESNKITKDSTESTDSNTSRNASELTLLLLIIITILLPPLGVFLATGDLLKTLICLLLTLLFFLPGLIYGLIVVLGAS